MSKSQVKKSTPVQGHIHVHPIDKYIEMLTTTSTSTTSSSSTTTSDAGSVNAIASKALSDPKVFSGFAELSSLPLVQQHASRALLNTLELFSFGTFQDYCSKASSSDGDGKGSQKGGFYNRLTEAQLMKLKALTVVSTINRCNDNDDDNDAVPAAVEVEVPQSQSRRSRRRQILQQTSPTTAAADNSKTATSVPNNNNTNSNTNTNTNTSGIITYATLQAQLNHPNTNEITNNNDDTNNTNNTKEEIRKLEDLLIHCIYSNLLPSGTKLDQKNLLITVKLQVNSCTSLDASHVLCRDVHLLDDLPNMIRTLEEFSHKGKDTRERLEDLNKRVGGKVRGDLEDWREVDLEILLKESRVGSGTGGTGTGTGTGEDGKDDGKGGMMEWSSSAGADRQVKRSRAAGGGGSGGGGRNSGFFGFGKKG